MSAPGSPPGAAPAWAPGYAHATSDLPPIACRARAEPDDFVVEELPAYEPAGAGTHLYLWVEKRGLSTFGAVRALARFLGRRAIEFGYAGLKDADAVTRQWISIEHVDPARFDGFEHPRVRVLERRLHTNKLRVGHLRGNRFHLVLRDVAPADEGTARAVLERLAQRGLPNYYGPQRFGRAGDSFELGRLLLAGDLGTYLLRATETDPDSELGAALAGDRPLADDLARRVKRRLGDPWRALVERLQRGPCEAGELVRRVPAKLRQLHVSALQSRVFNAVLSRRMPAVDRLEPGDLAWKHANGAVFAVEPDELEAAGERAARFELSPSGPIPGWRMTRAAGRPGALEDEELAALGLELASFKGVGFGLDQKGARRPLRVPLGELAVGRDGGALRLRFALPKGSYATTVIEELSKGFQRHGPPSR